jgi:hypothetical protein
MIKAPTASWLRVEGLALGLICVWLYSFQQQPWWLFALLFLAPDLSMLGYLAGPRVGAFAYNVVHSWALVAILALAGSYLWGGNSLLLPLAFILGAHIGFDRKLGYGLKLATGFHHTDLGRIGRA